MSSTLLHVEKLQKSYGDQVALRDVSFSAQAGEFITILGRSGAGKSTLMRCINRLVEPTAGSIVFNDRPLPRSGRQLRQHRRNIGMIFQHFNLVKRLPVIENVLTGLLGYKSLFAASCRYFTREERLRALECLDRVDIAHKAFQRSDTLSGGEQQRVAIARALNQSPILVLADEPVASLDPTIARTVLGYLRRINQESGITVLLNIHQVNYAHEFGSRIIGLARGEIVFDGHEDQLSNDILHEIYGGVPEETYDEIG